MHESSSWEELVQELKEDFLPYDYQQVLWEEIRRRTQGAKEKVIIYIYSIENLLKKLESNPPSESEQVDSKKLSALNSDATCDTSEYIFFIRINQTDPSCRETSIRIQEFVPPLTNTCRLLEPELAYKDSTEGYKHPHPLNCNN